MLGHLWDAASQLLKVVASCVAHKVQVGKHLFVTTTQEGNPDLDPNTRSGRLLPPWVLARAHLMPLRDLGDERRPGSRRGG